MSLSSISQPHASISSAALNRPMSANELLSKLKTVSGPTIESRVNAHLEILKQIESQMSSLPESKQKEIQASITTHYKDYSYLGHAVTNRLNPAQRVSLLGATQHVEFKPELVKPIEIPAAIKLLQTISSGSPPPPSPPAPPKQLQYNRVPVNTEQKPAITTHQRQDQVVAPIHKIANAIQTTHEWADHVAIQAVANATKTNIVIFDVRTDKSMVIQSATPTNTHIGVSYNGGHYQAVSSNGSRIEAMKIVGDCFYDSVAYGLNQRSGTASHTARSLRHAAATELRTHQDRYTPFIVEDIKAPVPAKPTRYASLTSRLFWVQRPTPSLVTV